MKLELRGGILMAETEYGLALLDENSGEYWTLNPTAAVVLETMLAGRGTDEAVHALTERYDVSDSLAQQDVDRILTELRSAGLIGEN
ncbi:lasso peptide biosynthesis PqqD family chaperone [Streptomyces sp. NPDC049099]|uniref:lasso peptide biosynthesis PqqD family chaperone n=1 Tax=Streptomyces sp. NPDC049099 TaxID=3155768 RepID=UPI0034263EA6